jgi:hypothetical protein
VKQQHGAGPGGPPDVRSEDHARPPAVHGVNGVEPGTAAPPAYPAGGVVGTIRRLGAAITKEAVVLTTPPSAVDPEVAAPGGRTKGELYNTFGNAFSRAFELTVTPTIFGFIGYRLDLWLGILPVLTIVLVLMAIIGMLVRTWYGYVHHMEALEAASPWAGRRPVT